MRLWSSGLVIALSLMCAQAWSAEVPQAELAPKDPAKRIAGLEFAETVLPLAPLPRAKSAPGKPAPPASYRVVIVGKYPPDKPDLLIGTRKVPLNKQNGAFRVSVVLRGASMAIPFRIINAYGKAEEQVMVLRLLSKGARSAKARRSSRWGIQVGAGFSSNSYTAPDDEHYAQFSITPKLAVNYVLSPQRWSIGGSAFFSALPLSSAGPEPVTIRYLGANLRLAYQLPFVKDPWQVAIQAGVYYNSMLTDSEYVGYTNVMGPQIYPVIGRRLFKDNWIRAYFKYSPVSTNLSIFDLNSREIAAGIIYSFPVYFGSSPTYLMLTVDFADLSVWSEFGTARNKSWTFGLGVPVF